MIIVTKVNRTCWACPAQWDGETSDGRRIYARYRHGHFRVGVSDDEIDAVNAAYDRPVVDLVKGDSLDGWMEYDQLKEWTAGKIQWPAEDGESDG